MIEPTEPNETTKPLAGPRNLLPDSDVEKMLENAGIPRRWRGKECTLAGLGTEPAKLLRQWLEGGEHREVTGRVLDVGQDSRESLDLCMRLARGMVLTGCGVRVMSIVALLDLIQGGEDERGRTMAELLNVSWLMVLGVIDAWSPENAPFKGEDKLRLDWFMRRWLIDGRNLILQGDRAMAEDRFWSQGLRSLANGALVLPPVFPPRNDSRTFHDTAPR